MSAIVIRPQDIEVEFFRAGGKGGQKQNKTSSGARVRHLPTGLTGESRVERSQTQNRRRAMVILLDKIRAIYLGDQRARREAEYREKPEASFGSQLRTYVLCGKDQRVVDHESGAETRNARAVLDGGLEPFIRARLADRV